MYSKFIKALAVAALVVLGPALARAVTCAGGTALERYTIRGTEVYCLDQSGNITSSGTITSTGRIKTSSNTVSVGLKIGTSSTGPSTMPTTTTGVNYGVKVPYYNSGSATIPAGAIVVANSTDTLVSSGHMAPVLSTTSWMGVNEYALASGGTGYMTVSGYALVLTTGVVQQGDLVTSTGTVPGYGGAIAGAATVLEGTVVGKAMSQGTAAGGLTLIRVGN